MLDWAAKGALNYRRLLRGGFFGGEVSHLIVVASKVDFSRSALRRSLDVASHA